VYPEEKPEAIYNSPEVNMIADSEELPSLKDLILVLRQRFWIILLTGIVLTGLALGYSMTQPPRYEATARVVVVQKAPQEQAGDQSGFVPSNLESDVGAVQTLAAPMTEAMQSRRVAQHVVQQLNLKVPPEALLAGLVAEPIEATQFIDITYNSEDPELATKIANAFAEQSSEVALPVSPTSNRVSTDLWESAQVPTRVGPNTLRNGLIGLALGLVLGVGLAFLLEYLQNKPRSSKDVERVSGVPTLGIVPAYGVVKSARRQARWRALRRSWRWSLRGSKGGHQDSSRYESLITTTDPYSSTSEAYRFLRTNLLYAHPHARTIVFTSPGPSASKSVVCANLGVVLAQAEKRTLLLDCDPFGAGLSRLFCLENSAGMAEVLRGEHDLEEVLEEPLPRLSVISSGSMPPDPVELLGPDRFSTFLASVRDHFDYVLTDALPIGTTPESAILARQSDGILLTFRLDEVRKEGIAEAVRRLRMVDINILGTALCSPGASGVDASLSA
jgi:receptor protein-tyrosine kinase